MQIYAFGQIDQASLVTRYTFNCSAPKSKLKCKSFILKVFLLGTWNILAQTFSGERGWQKNESEFGILDQIVRTGPWGSEKCI